MFRTQISNPIDPIPYEYINTLKRPYNEPDFSLACLGIALLRSRCDYHGITGRYWIEGSLKAAYEKFMVDINEMPERPLLDYFIFTEKEADLNEQEDKMIQLGYKRKNTIEKLVMDKSGNECLAYYHSENNTAAIFINTRDIRLYHLLISFVPLYFPALFKEQPLKPEEYEIIKALSKPDSGVFVNNVREAMKPYVAEFRHIQLSGLIQQMHESKIQNAKNDVESQQCAVQNYYDSYISAIEELKRYITIYEGTKATEQTDENETALVDYLCENENIRCIEIDGNTLSFIATSLLTNYNEDAWRVFSERGGIYDGEYHQRDTGAVLRDVFKDRNNRKKLLDSIFGEDPEFAIKMCGYYKLNLFNNGVHTRSRYDYVQKDASLESYMPNPHLNIHSCLGGYTTRISEAIQSGNYIPAIEMCVASSGSVNLDETDLTFRPFIGILLSSTKKVLRRKDGVEMTPEEALIYLIDKEKENEAD